MYHPSRSLCETVVPSQALYILVWPREEWGADANRHLLWHDANRHLVCDDANRHLVCDYANRHLVWMMPIVT